MLLPVLYMSGLRVKCVSESNGDIILELDSALSIRISLAIQSKLFQPFL